PTRAVWDRAAAASDRYAGQLRELAGGGERDPQELFFSIALDDVGAAARLLRPVYESSGGSDGFISFECTPDLADDTEATIAQAVTLWERLPPPHPVLKSPRPGPPLLRVAGAPRR